MFKTTKLVMVASTTLALLCSGASGAVLYQNDFGTTSQINEFTTVDGNTTPSTGNIGTVAHPTAGWDYVPGVDLDGDTFAQTLTVLGIHGGNGSFQGLWWKGHVTVNAPTGFTIDNPGLSALGVGKSTHSNYVRIGISVDGGSTWTDDLTGNHGSGTGAIPISVSTSHTGLSSFLVRVQINTAYDFGDTQNGLIQNITATGDLVPIPEPASMMMLVTGTTLILLPRRKRQV